MDPADWRVVVFQGGPFFSGAGRAEYLSGLLRRLRRQAAAKSLQNHAGFWGPSSILHLRVPVHADGPGSLPAGDGGSDPSHPGPGAVYRSGSD